MVNQLSSLRPEISLQLRQLRQQVFHPDPATFLNFEADQSWSVYHNANLSIHVTDKCNADCAFCIAHLRYLNDGNVYLKPEIEEDQRYYERLEQILMATAHLRPSVSITGGEPSVNRKLPTILNILARHNVRKRTITTNGTGLFHRTSNGSTVLEALADYQLEHLNISRAHDDTTRNAQIMVMQEHLMPEGRLQEIIQEAHRHGIKARLSCALLKHGISTVDDIMRYTDWAVGLGVDNVIFRQLMQFDEQRVQPGRIPIYCKEQAIALEPIWDFFDQHPAFELYHQVLGYYYYVEVRRYRGINVVSESADLRMINPQLSRYAQEFGKPTAFEMVYHPNGNLCAGWNEHEQVMSAYHE